MNTREQAFGPFLRSPMLSGFVLLAAAGGLTAAFFARQTLAPLVSEAELFADSYLSASSTAYPESVGRPTGASHASCDRLYTAYDTFTDALHGHGGKMVAVCHAKLKFQRCEALVSLQMTRSADLAEPWRVYNFKVACESDALAVDREPRLRGENRPSW